MSEKPIYDATGKPWWKRVIPPDPDLTEHTTRELMRRSARLRQNPTTSNDIEIKLIAKELKRRSKKASQPKDGEAYDPF